MQYFNPKLFSKPYQARFLKHLKTFIQETNLFNLEDNLLVAVSGGVDSVALLVALNELGYKHLSVVHFNHLTRDGNKSEQRLVEDLCKSLSIECTVRKLNIGSSNFEADARSRRYEVMDSLSGNFDRIVTAHHINDSLEWHLMSEFKSSSLKSSLGIPLIRGKYVRPFHAFTKKQICRFAKKIDLKYLNDPSNKSLDYERNYMRKRIEDLKQQYPSIEKHFVTRQNQLVSQLGFSAFKCGQYYMVESKKGIHLYSENLDFTDAYAVIEKIIKRLSLKNRGMLRSQIQKLIKSANLGRLGPLSFSGGVEVYSSFGHLFFKRVEVPLNKPRALEWKELDLKSFSEMKSRYHRYPFWVEIKGHKNIEARKTIPEFDTHGRYLSPMKLLYKWENDPHLKGIKLNIRFIC